MEDYIQSRINMLKLTGYSVVKLFNDYYVAYNDKNRIRNVYDDEFKPIIIGKQVEYVCDDFVKVRTDKGIEIYSSDGKLLASGDHKNDIQFGGDVAYITNGDRAEKIVTAEHTLILDRMNSYNIMDAISDKGNLYSLYTNGKLYCNHKLLDTDVQYGRQYFNKHYYTRVCTEGYKVYDIDTHKCITNYVWSEVQVYKDNLILTSTDKYKKFYLYSKGILKPIKLSNERETEKVEFLAHKKNMFLTKTYSNGLIAIIDLEGNRATDKLYTKVRMYEKPLVINESGKMELLDWELNTLIEAKHITVMNHRLVATEENYKRFIYYNDLQKGKVLHEIRECI